ncbi:peptidylprolyl isomerase [Rhodopila sp.]|jgi:peptidyl-prolyl cis-trans isomerase C|uniref:peptidylprolyl isomerase n=1 Tax=Rhodopila sp. TaxID=2480087 RepID=UPI002CF9E7B7|nr:peptidylprolyl isomerase [Rhodopila sp.]HVZ09845.1 peptidylprolyl isomerase [Rhodopila sp.]
MALRPDCSLRAPARALAFILAVGTVPVLPPQAQAQQTPAQQTPAQQAPTLRAPTPQTPAKPPAAGTATAPADPVLATVDGEPIHMSDLNMAAETLPAQARQLPPQQLYPMLLSQLVDSKALLIEARKAGLDKDPAVAKQMQAAADRALVTAMLGKEVRPQVTDAAVQAKFDKDNANAKGEEEVHARHILVPDEATAKKIIAELKKGGDFAALSKQYSKDPGAAQQGGDLGFFKKTDMVPEFATAAFALKDGEISPTPVKTQFGYHVIQVLGHRTAPPPKFDDVKDELRQKMIQDAIQQAVNKARAGVKIETFNMDGSPVKATDTAEPPPAAK